MAIPQPEPRDWQVANAKELQATDRQVLQLLRDAKKRVDAILKDLPAGQDIKRAQLEATRTRLMAEQADVFQRLGRMVEARRASAASRSLRLSAAADAALLQKVGKGAEAQFLYNSMLQVGQRAIDAALARLKLSALPLSQRIYNTSVWMGGRLGRLINETLASGLNAREFAKRARDWFSPNTPGGVRYAAMRLARTEINNAFHAMSAKKYAETPWTTEVLWNLSKSHPRLDICNKVAADSPYPKEKTPARPHPQCMCYITAEYVDEDDFVENFLKGDYDEYLDAELERNGWNEPEAKSVETPAKNLLESVAKGAKFQTLKEAGMLEIGSEFIYHGDSKATFTIKGKRVRVDPARAASAGQNARVLVDVETGSIVGQQANAAAKWWIERVAELTGQQAIDAVPKGLPKRGTMTPHQRAALKVYETGWFTVINNFLRDNRWGDPDYKEEERDILRIDSAMAESVLPSDIQIWRGMYRSTRVFGVDRFAGDLTGFAWEEKAFSSTTADESIVDKFNLPGMVGQDTENVKMVVHVPAGTKALVTSTFEKGSKANGPQAEITLQRDMKWTVVKDNGFVNGVRQLEVRADPIGPETKRATQDAGEAERKLQPSSTTRADQPVSTGSNRTSFDDRLAKALTGEDALDATPWGLERKLITQLEFRPDWQISVDLYTGSLFKDINRLLRGFSLVNPEDRQLVEETSGLMDAAFDATPGIEAEVVSYRGMMSGSQLFGSRIDHDLSGFEWLEEAYTSTTSVAARTRTFTGSDDDVLMRILIPKGSKVINASPIGAEAELLVARNTRYRVLRDNGRDPEGKRLLDVELVSHETPQFEER